MPIANRLYTKASLKLKIPTSPESDGEIYLTPNNSVSIEEDKNGDSVATNNSMNVKPPPRTKNGYRIDKIQSMSSIANKNFEVTSEDQTDSGINVRFDLTSDSPIFRMNSLGNLSQYGRDSGSAPKSLLKLREDFENRRMELLAQRKSGDNLKSSNFIETNSSSFVRPTNPIKRAKKRFGIGDTKYIGTDNDTPESKQYHLTKMKSLGTIPDSMINERINYDPFLTPMIPRRHPASLHSFEEESRNDLSDSNGSSDLDEQENFLRHQPDEHVRFMHESNLLKSSFERGFRRSYNKKHDRVAKPTIPFRQSDGFFQVPHIPGGKSSHHQQQKHQSQPNRSSIHSLPTDGKFEVTRYDVVLSKLNKTK